MNTLHWHIIDAESFPIVSESIPNLSKAGAYSPNAIYSPDMVKDVVSYAKYRGVRVVAEFDVPGHSYSWGKSDANLVVNCPAYSHNINNIPLNPTLNNTYEVLTKFFGDMAPLFPDRYMHTGGDEVVFGCFTNNPQVSAWMKQMGFTRPQQLLPYFEDKMHKIFTDVGKTQMFWQDVFDSGYVPPNGSIVQVWSNPDDLQGVCLPLPPTLTQ